MSFVQNLSNHVKSSHVRLHCHILSLIGDGVCQDENNIQSCWFDGNDCCKEEDSGNFTECDICQCNEDCKDYVYGPNSLKLWDLCYHYEIAGNE